MKTTNTELVIEDIKSLLEQKGTLERKVENLTKTAEEYESMTLNIGDRKRHFELLDTKIQEMEKDLKRKRLEIVEMDDKWTLSKKNVGIWESKEKEIRDTREEIGRLHEDVQELTEKIRLADITLEEKRLKIDDSVKELKKNQTLSHEIKEELRKEREKLDEDKADFIKYMNEERNTMKEKVLKSLSEQVDANENFVNACNEIVLEKKAEEQALDLRIEQKKEEEKKWAKKAEEKELEYVDIDFRIGLADVKDQRANKQVKNMKKIIQELQIKYEDPSLSVFLKQL